MKTEQRSKHAETTERSVLALLSAPRCVHNEVLTLISTGCEAAPALCGAFLLFGLILFLHFLNFLTLISFYFFPSFIFAVLLINF